MMFVSPASFFIASVCRRTISANDVPCAASVVPNRMPVSSEGKSPFGTSVYSTPVATRMSTENTSVSGRWLITQARLRS